MLIPESKNCFQIPDQDSSLAQATLLVVLSKKQMLVCKGVPAGSQHLLWLDGCPTLPSVGVGWPVRLPGTGIEVYISVLSKTGASAQCSPVRLLNCLGPQEGIRKHSLPLAEVPDFPIPVGQQVELYDHVLVWNISCLEIHKNLTSAYER